ncbi:ATP synthase subunit I [Pseudacidobacterium ailaaui]|uniref:ATP synthase subunit I n=1 Tax=Pseudacidobacterium ailaaui TaxID=1382359 RepID=UPI0009DFBD35|nr:ATP synthase subunit I [Pseudacidobacterium ailaaui]
MTESGNPMFDFSDADLKSALQRSLKATAIAGVVIAVVLAIAFGWQTGVLLLVGAAVSVTGIWEWQRLVAFINARLDNQRPSAGAGRVVAMFILRLILAGAALYLSLKYLNGSVYALIGGLGLAVLVLTIEAVRLIRS